MLTHFVDSSAQSHDNLDKPMQMPIYGLLWPSSIFARDLGMQVGTQQCFRSAN
jgi:hypothetical protein